MANFSLYDNLNASHLANEKIQNLPSQIARAMPNSNEYLNVDLASIADEFGKSLSRVLGWTVLYLAESEWYDMGGIDVILTFSDRYDLQKLIHSKSTLIKISWVHDVEDKVLLRPWIGMYDIILCLSEKRRLATIQMQPFPAFCAYRCPCGIFKESNLIGSSRAVPVEVLHTAAIQNLSSIWLNDPGRGVDYVIIARHSERSQIILNFNPDAVKKYRGIIYGAWWNEANVSDSFKAIYRGIPASRFVPLSACLNANKLKFFISFLCSR